ncbi:phospholipase ABHD3-like [Styela clava]
MNIRAGSVYVFVGMIVYTCSGLASWSISMVVGFVAWYWHHYHTNYGKLPLVICNNWTRLGKFLDNHVPTLKRPYMPVYWFAESRAQTIIRYFLPSRSNLKWEREILKEHDGGLFGVDWCYNNDSERFPDHNTRPTVIIIPGLTSTTESGYVQSIARCLESQGFRIAVLIYRGLEDMELKTPRTYCATHTADLERLVEVFKERYPESKLYAIGASLGSLILGRYMSERGDNIVIDAGMLFCCPFHPPTCMEELELWSNKFILNTKVTEGVKETMYRRHSHVFGSVIDHEKVEKSSFLREFDSYFTAPIFGYKDTEEYYNDSSLDADKLNAIARPVLCVGSNDDPFSPERGLPKEEIAQTENVALVMTYGGGHVSHLEGWNPLSKSYFEKVMMEYLDAMVQGKY